MRRPPSKELKPRAATGLAAGRELLPDLRALIAQSRESVARGVNSALVHLYWQIGWRIHKDVLAQRRAEYGTQIVAALGRDLEAEFGRGFGEKNLHRMVQFAEAFPNEEIVAALRRQLVGLIFERCCPSKMRQSALSMRRCAGWKTEYENAPAKN